MVVSSSFQATIHVIKGLKATHDPLTEVHIIPVALSVQCCPSPSVPPNLNSACTKLKPENPLNFII